MSKASIQLSINFLVVMIICIVLLGIGIKLMSTFISGAEKMQKEVDNYHKEQLRKAMNEGAMVAAFPVKLTINRGDNADFSIGIANELGQEQVFSLFMNQTSINTGSPPKILYLRSSFTIKNNEQYFTPVRIIIPKDATHGTYIFNVYVCKGETCIDSSPDRYGDLQKLYVNVN
jgi:hypothetical protein